MLKGWYTPYLALSPRLDSPHKAKWGKAGFPLMVVPTVGAVGEASPPAGTHHMRALVPAGGAEVGGRGWSGYTT